MPDEYLRDIFFRGCTRPAMVLGVPLVPLVLVGSACMLLAMWGLLFSPWFALIAGGVMIVSFGIMRQITYFDDQRLRQWQLRLVLRMAGRQAYHLWGAVSYGPFRYRRR